LHTWSLVAAEVSALDPDLLTECADAIVTKCFGWGPGSQRFWRGAVVEEPPDLDRVRESVSFLRGELGLNDSEIAQVVKKFPEVLRLDVNSRMRSNTEYMRTTWSLTGGRLTDAVKAQPQVLGYDVDCGGDCQGECARCWARF
jgi:hypothetical protein